MASKRTSAPSWPSRVTQAIKSTTDAAVSSVATSTNRFSAPSELVSIPNEAVLPQTRLLFKRFQHFLSINRQPDYITLQTLLSDVASIDESQLSWLRQQLQAQGWLERAAVLVPSKSQRGGDGLRLAAGFPNTLLAQAVVNSPLRLAPNSLHDTIQLLISQYPLTMALVSMKPRIQPTASIYELEEATQLWLQQTDDWHHWMSLLMATGFAPNPQTANPEYEGINESSVFVLNWLIMRYGDFPIDSSLSVLDVFPLGNVIAYAMYGQVTNLAAAQTLANAIINSPTWQGMESICSLLCRMGADNIQVARAMSLGHPMRPNQNLGTALAAMPRNFQNPIYFNAMNYENYALLNVLEAAGYPVHPVIRSRSDARRYAPILHNYIRQDMWKFILQSVPDDDLRRSILKLAATGHQ